MHLVTAPVPYRCNSTMEDRTANLISAFLIALLLLLIIITRLCFKLSETFFLICGASIAATLAVAAVYVIRARYTNRHRQLERQIDEQGRELRIEYSFLRKVAGVPTKFRFRELEEATDGFRSIIGRGASGSVYKGILTNGTAVAVKRIDGGDDRVDKAFKSEVAAIASIQHVNLVRLIGYCSPAEGPRFLVYEFVDNGSLDNWIFPRVRAGGGNKIRRWSRGGCLSWELRRRVALDVAKGLAYLHHDCRSCILHLDVKPENILIDGGFRAVVSDFGLSKLKRREESRVVTTTIRGTKGYLAPEWLLENGVSEKSDVYSYGMVLLEIIGGRRSICVLEAESGSGGRKKKLQYFPQVVAEKYGEGKVMEIVDERLTTAAAIDEREVREVVRVALWCIQEKPKLRPSMAEVVEMLQGHLAIEDPPSTQMLVVDLLSINEDGDERRRPRAGCCPIPRFAQMASTSSSSFAFSSPSPR